MSDNHIQQTLAIYGDEFWITCPNCKHRTYVNTANPNKRIFKSYEAENLYKVRCWFCSRIAALIHIAPVR